VSGPLTYQGLYGGEAPAETDPAATRTLRFLVPRGTTPAAPLGLPFVANAVLADNPSGWWYYINGRWLPPWTIGAVLSIDPPSSQLEVAAQTPAGAIPEDAGGDLILVASEARLPPVAGLYAQSQQVLAVRDSFVQASEGGTAVSPVVAAVAGRRIGLLALIAGPMHGLLAHSNLRDWVTLIAYGEPTHEVLTRVSISPSAPHATAPIAPGLAQTQAGDNLTIIATTRAGSGSQGVSFDVAYYLA
jgi:hypothetical protein